MPEPSPSEDLTLHPAAIAVWAVDGLKRAGLGIIPLILVAGLWGLIGVPFIAAFALIRFLTFRYQVHDNAVVISGGLIFKWRRVLPFNRIQSVDLVEKLTHRMLGVVELRIEVIGGSETEAQLVALLPAEAERLRSLILGSGAPATPEDEAPAPPLVRMNPKELVLFGITGGRVAVLGVLLAPLFEVLPEDQIDELFDRLAPILRMGVLVVAAIVALFLIASAALSVLATVLTFWNFTLTWESGRLLITKGLLETRRTLIPLKRIQAVQLQENFVRRIFGLASVKVLVAGFGKEQDQGGESSTLLPIGPRARALALVAEILACQDLENAPLIPAPRRALVRRTLYVLVAALILVPAGVAIMDAGGLIAGGVALAAGAFAFAAWTQLGHAVVEGHLVVRSGFLLRRTTFLPVDNVQRLSLRVSPTQRLTRLASLRLGIAGSPVSGGLSGADLDRRLAELRFSTVSEMMTRTASMSAVQPAVEEVQ